MSEAFVTEPQLAAALGGNPLVAHLLWQRGLRTVEDARGFLDPDFFTPTSPFELPGMTETVARLRTAIQHNEKILIWGDFDVDGQTATSVLLLGLRAAGANVSFTIPDRATHSHGLNKPELAQAREQGASVLLTCDCGVTDFEEVAFARRLGFDVIITDHHDLGDGLPDALAIINPKRMPPDTPLANLPGVGVAYKVVEALHLPKDDGRWMMDDESSMVHRPSSPDLLDLVALGIVSDLAYLRGDTRYLLQRGLAQLRRSARPGIRALMQAANLEASSLSADDIGFQIGPRLNAIGRLDKAEMGVRLLTTEDAIEARELAGRIEELNSERKVIQRKVEDDAARMIERNPGLIRQPVIILQSEDWHPSVIGIAASGLARRFGKPAMLIAGRAGEVGRGSARSVEGVDIHAAIAASHKLIVTSGGHPMAAGFGIHSDNIPAFRDAIGQHVRKQVMAAAAGDEPSAGKEADAEVDWSENWLPLAAELERLAPFGAGNPRPVLISRNLSVTRTETMGKDGLHRTLFLRDDAGRTGAAKWWNSGNKSVPDGALDVAFSLEMNAYRGRLNAQARIEALIPRADTAPSDAPVLAAKFAITDLRGVLDRAGALREVVAKHGAENVQIFAENSPLPAGWAGNGRLAIQPAPVLVFWDSPPSADVLRGVVDAAQPQHIVLLTAFDETADTPEVVIKNLAAMKKTAQKRGDSLDDTQVLARMAARVGQRVEVVQAGMAGVTDQLRYWLEETRAFRKFVQVAGAGDVVKS